MKKDIRPNKAVLSRKFNLLQGAALAFLWGAPIGTMFLRGGLYLHIGIFLAALSVAFFRAYYSSKFRIPKGPGCGIASAMLAWFLAATFSTVANFRTEEVLPTYWTVFLFGAAIYFGLKGVKLNKLSLDLGILGLVAGAMVPLINGLVAFRREWGWSDLSAVLDAYLDTQRMEIYEYATFGNRGNTAALIVIIAPLFFWVTLDRARWWCTRIACAGALVPIFMTLLVLEVRAAFLTLGLIFFAICAFRVGKKHYIFLVVGISAFIYALFHYLPEYSTTVLDRISLAVRADAEHDASVYQRLSAMQEAVSIGERHWMLGIGPGGALTIHSMTSAHEMIAQQFMETGLLGMLASISFSCGVLFYFMRTLARGCDSSTNNLRMTMAAGPACYVLYGIIANVASSVGFLNVWTVLVVSMLAMSPPFSRTQRGLIGRPRIARNKDSVREILQATPEFKGLKSVRG